MAPQKWRRVGGRLKDTSNPDNTCGFAALPDEIYLEILSQVPSTPIPISIHVLSYRSRRETFRSLSQTCRSLRRFFWRYLWQHIEVREGIKLMNRDEILKDTGTITAYKNFAKELLSQLKIVTVRKPELAQYVNYLNVSIGQRSIEKVLAELARCLSLFPNLHTVQIDVISSSITLEMVSESVIEKTFRKYSYPQIRNVFVVRSSVPFVASCPQARRVGLEAYRSILNPYRQPVKDNCPHLEVLEDFGDGFWTPTSCKFVINNFPNLRTIQFMIFLLEVDENPSNINVLTKLNHLQTIIMTTPSLIADAHTERVKEDWIESAKRVLIQIQLRDNLEKTIVVRDYKGNERRILMPS